MNDHGHPQNCCGDDECCMDKVVNGQEDYACKDDYAQEALDLAWQTAFRVLIRLMEDGHPDQLHAVELLIEMTSLASCL